jgi:hypothetical protein
VETVEHRNVIHTGISAAKPTRAKIRHDRIRGIYTFLALNVFRTSTGNRSEDEIAVVEKYKKKYSGQL